MRSKLWAFLVVFILLSYPLFARPVDPVAEKLGSLEKTVQTMQNDSVARNEKVASAISGMDQIKQEYRSVVGSIDGNAHQVRMLQDELNRLKRDITDRLSAIEERLQIYDMQISRAVAKISPKDMSETDNYQKGLDHVQNGEFLSGVASFKAFLKSYPKSELSDNAQYWIAECYYAMKDHAKAIKEFQLVVDKYPRSDKVSGAILKQGFSFAELGMPEEAKAFLTKVIKDYPSSQEAVYAREKIDKIDKKSADAAITSSIINSTPPEDAHSAVPMAPGLKREMQQQKAKDLAPEPSKKAFSGAQN